MRDPLIAVLRMLSRQYCEAKGEDPDGPVGHAFEYAFHRGFFERSNAGDCPRLKAAELQKWAEWHGAVDVAHYVPTVDQTVPGMLVTE
jgi:hypothetical protein